MKNEPVKNKLRGAKIGENNTTTRKIVIKIPKIGNRNLKPITTKINSSKRGKNKL